jgi:hypothetical protein
VIAGPIRLKDVPTSPELALDSWRQATRERHGAVVASFPMSNGEEMLSSVHVFDPEAERFGETGTGPVHDMGYEGVDSVHRAKQGLHLLTRKDGRGPPWPTDPQVRFDRPDGFDDDVAVEEDEGVERLILRRRGHVSLVGEVGEKSLDVRGA